MTSNREGERERKKKKTIYLTPSRNMEFSCWGRICFPAESVERNRGGKMCREMSTGFFFSFCLWSGCTVVGMGRCQERERGGVFAGREGVPSHFL